MWLIFQFILVQAYYLLYQSYKNTINKSMINYPTQANQTFYHSHLSKRFNPNIKSLRNRLISFKQVKPKLIIQNQQQFDFPDYFVKVKQNKSKKLLNTLSQDENMKIRATENINLKSKNKFNLQSFKRLLKQENKNNQSELNFVRSIQSNRLKFSRKQPTIKQQLRKRQLKMDKIKNQSMFLQQNELTQSLVPMAKNFKSLIIQRQLNQESKKQRKQMKITIYNKYSPWFTDQFKNQLKIK